jgi:hypothetical protein
LFDGIPCAVAEEYDGDAPFQFERQDEHPGR